MNDTASMERLEEEGPGASGYASFVLRCWTGQAGQVHARLMDIHTGITHLLGDLGDLPELVQQLVAGAPMVPERADDSAEQVGKEKPNRRRKE
jgi:hypothetical protein